MLEVLQLLQQLGFGEYEARAYVALLRRSPLNGYELAKESGLPRANVYSVLQKLEERGAVARVSSPSGERYVPVPPVELAGRIGSHFEATLDKARRSLEEISAPAVGEYIWNAQGYTALLDHARSLLEAARERVLIAIWPEESRELAGALSAAESRGVDITTLCLMGCPHECGSCRGTIFRYRTAPEMSSRWLVLAADGQEVVAGEIGRGETARMVRTRQPLVVELAGSYIRNSIALANILSDLGDRLPGMLSPDTLHTLSTLGPRMGRETGWLESWHRILALSNQAES